MSINSEMNIGEPSYVIDQENGVVECTLNNTKTAFTSFIISNFKMCPWEFFHDSARKRLDMPATFVGRAKCDPRDTFNEDYGKRLAYSRAKRNMTRSFFKRANFFANYMDDLLSDAVDTFNAYGVKLSSNDQRRQDWLKTHEQQSN